MLDADVVAVSPASVWRVLKQAGLLSRWKGKSSRKGTGFEQPLAPHQHWHVDVSYINLMGTFYYLCRVLDGCSRYLVHWDLRESMKEADIEMILERAKEKHPQARPRTISDNRPQFIARDFKEFIRHLGDDAGAHFAVLSAVERQNRTLAQVAEAGVHSTLDAVVARRCAACGFCLLPHRDHGIQRDEHEVGVGGESRHSMRSNSDATVRPLRSRSIISSMLKPSSTWHGTV
jgi:Integrase core domain